MKTIEVCSIYKSTYFGNERVLWHEPYFDLLEINLPDEVDLKQMAEKMQKCPEGCQVTLVKYGKTFPLHSVRTGLEGRVITLNIKSDDGTAWALYTNIRSESGKDTTIKELRQGRRESHMT